MKKTQAKVKSETTREPDIKRLSIRSAPVFVGDCKLSLREPGYCSLIEISEMMFDERLGTSLKKIAGTIRDAFTSGFEASSKAGAIAQLVEAGIDVVRDGVVPLLGRQLREVVVILLDTQKNRDLVAHHLVAIGLQDQGFEFEVEVDEDDIDSCPGFRRWVRRSITAEQFDHVIEEFQGLRGWAELGKRMIGRFGLGSLSLNLTDDEPDKAPTGSPATPS